MTREEAIEILECNYPVSSVKELCEAVDMAIEALSTSVHPATEITYVDVWNWCNARHLYLISAELLDELTGTRRL